MAMGVGFLELVFFLLLGFPSDLPLAMPPAPENPKMLAVAPEKCLAYLSWSGTAEASPDSANHTERLLADPEIRRCLVELKIRLKAAVRQGAGSAERAQKVADELPVLIETVATRPTSLFLEDISVQGRAPNITGGLVVHLGERAKDFETAWMKIEEALEQTGDVEKVGDLDWHVMPTPTAAGVPTRWSVSDGYFVLAVGADSGPAILARLNGDKTAPWLSSIRKRLDVPRVSTVSYVNVKQILAMAIPTLQQVAPEQAATFEKLGFTKIEFLASVNGLNETHSVSRTWLKCDGMPAAFLKAFDSKPLTPDDLKPIPADATVAAALRFDADKTLKEFVSMMGALFGGATTEEVHREFDSLSADLGFSIREDLLPALGDSWRVYCSPSEGGGLFSHWTGVVSVADPKKMADLATVISFKAKEARRRLREENSGRGRRFVTIEQTKAGEHDISFMNVVGNDDVPFAPAWCFTGTELVVSTFPQGVRAYLNRKSDEKSLAELPDVAGRFGGKSAPHFYARYDAAAIARSVYPLILHFGNIIFAQLQREGLEFDISMLPALPPFLRNLQPGSVEVFASDEGLELRNHRTLPLGGGGPILLLPLTLFSARSEIRTTPVQINFLDALSPERTHVNISQGHLKQIALAMHFFHDTNSAFPGAFSVDGKGKRLLSWRVHLLPFLEQQNLFREFHLDEPWDSPHNKKLIPRMPAVFKSPGSKAGEGKTHYVALRADGTLLSGEQGKSLADVRDGSSNTVMVVEASEKAAVTWTAPDDLDFDEKDPKKNLFGLRRAGVLAAMSDGAVRTLPESIDSKTLRLLFLIDDGQPLPEF